jgi:hypothetical protein
MDQADGACIVGGCGTTDLSFIAGVRSTFSIGGGSSSSALGEDRGKVGCH